MLENWSWITAAGNACFSTRKEDCILKVYVQGKEQIGWRTRCFDRDLQIIDTCIFQKEKKRSKQTSCDLLPTPSSCCYAWFVGTDSLRLQINWSV